MTEIPDEVWLTFRAAVEAMYDSGATLSDVTTDVAEIFDDWQADA